jgi:glycosyltransferase involved in cell wall biosynthesis
MKILFLPRYSRQGASSRYRLWQYLPLFEREGHAIEVRPLLDSSYLSHLYQRGKRSVRSLAFGYARRLFSALDISRFDAVICEQEALPFLPVAIEKLFRRKHVRFFLDFDDAAHIKYAGHPTLQSKISSLMNTADGVVVGNACLRSYASQFTPRVSVIPTVLDISRYPLHPESAYRPNDEVRIGWIGTPSTSAFLQGLSHVFHALQKKFCNLHFRFVGAAPGMSTLGLNADIVEWSEKTEVELLAGCDLGIMPLPDTDFTRGKCGLKLIQYMACWLPTVASPVGANCEIIEDGKTGFLAGTDQDWINKLSVLIVNSGLRRELGSAGRRRVEQRYTLESGFARWKKVLDGALEPSGEVAMGLIQSPDFVALGHESRGGVR